MTTLAKEKTKLTPYPFLTAVALFMMFGFGFVVKPWATVTPTGVGVLGVYLGVLLMLICTKEMIWPPILGIFALVVHGYTTAAGALSSWMGNSTVVALLFILAICGALRESGAPVVLANWLMTRKITKGRPKVFLFMLFFAATILSMLTTGTATILMMYQVADGLMEACGYDKDSKEHKFILLGIYTANIGAYMLPFKGVHLSTLAVATGIMATYGIELNNLTYLISCFVLVVSFIIVYILMMEYVFKCNLKPLATFDSSKLNLKGSGTQFNSRQAVLLCAFLAGIVFLLAQSFIAKGTPIADFIKGMGTTWIWIVIFCALAIPHQKDGKSFINAGTLIRDNAMWGTICMIGCISMCGQAISKDELGIKQWLLDLSTPLLGNMGYLPMVIVAVTVCVVLTQFMNGSPIAYIFNTLCLPFACMNQLEGIGSATAICSAITFCGFYAYITPAASSTAPLITGHKNMTSKFLWTVGWVYTGVWIVLAIISFYFTGLIVG